MTEHDKQADRLEHEADTLDQRSAELGEDIAAAKERVEEMRHDETVPSPADTPESGELPPPDPGETD